MKRNILSLLCALISFLLLMVATSGEPDNASLLDKIDMGSYVHGLAFFFGWGLGFPNTVAYICSIITVLTIYFGLFSIFRCCFNSELNNR